MTAPTISTAYPLDTPVGHQLTRAYITITRRHIAGSDQYRVEVHSGSGLGGGLGSPLVDEHTKTCPNVDTMIDHVAWLYGFYGDPDETIEPTPTVETIEPRTPLAAALANLAYAGWSVAKLAAELGVSRSAVYRWRKGATPNDTNTAALIRLSTDLGDRGAGCGCRGYGRIQVTTGPVATFLRCSCNPAA